MMMNNQIEILINKIKYSYESLNRETISEIEKIRLVEIELPETVNGIYYCQNGNSVIALNINLSEQEKKQTFWHEFYHYCMSVGNYIFNSCYASLKEYSTKEEYKANLFVSLLLIDEVYKNETIYSIMDRCDVTEDIARIRFEYELKKYN
jgi:Zn-dependent peptidase ImmA (M78 family)